MSVSGSIPSMLTTIIVSMMLCPSSAASTKLRSSQPLVAAPAASPSASPVAAPVAAPKAGDLVAKVKTQLATDHRALGKYSASLMSVQSEVDKTEASMLGKVLDLQTARTFFTRHEEINTANKKKEAVITSLNGQVEGLSAQLNKAQKEYLTNSKQNMLFEGRDHLKNVENQALIKSLNTELIKTADVQATLKRLSAIHKNLLNEAVTVTKTGETASRLLSKERASSATEVRKHKSLREQLVRMNNYSVACHADVTRASKQLGMVLLSESKDNQAALLTLKQKKRATDAAEQRLLAERAVLVTETKKAENEATEEVSKLKDLRGDLNVLENNILVEVEKLQAEIRAEKARVKSLSADLMANSQSDSEDMIKKEAMDKHLEDLVKKVHDDENPIIIATTEGQNDALQTELNDAYGLWKSAKTSETTALLDLDSAKAQAQAGGVSLALAEKALKTAREEGQKKVAEAVKVAAESKAKSQALIEKAQAAVAARCKSKWDEIWKGKRGQLMKCKALKEELNVEKAKQESLKLTLQAKSMSDSP